jgi:coenzyme F420-reducing hydrogenase alpha subunit
MSRKILLKQATRIEGNAQIHVEVENNKITVARFMVQDFRGFERFMQGRRIEYVPHMISRICGLCSASHQVAGLRAIEDALALNVPLSVNKLRDIIILAERLSSHAFSYFFLSLPDFIGASRGVFELMKSHPDITRDALAIRKTGQDIVAAIGKRAIHPMSMGIGRFLSPVAPEDLHSVREMATHAKEKVRQLIHQVTDLLYSHEPIQFPSGFDVNFLTYSNTKDAFYIYGRKGEQKMNFSRDSFEQNVAEMRAEWSLAKFPYLISSGFPEGIMLVGPLARSFVRGGFMDDDEIRSFPLARLLSDPDSLTLESYDICRLLEIFSVFKNILSIIDEIEDEPGIEANIDQSGKGLGVIEAPRGVLIHSYLINRGSLEKIRLLVATQFNNAYINLLIRDLAEKHKASDRLTEEGEHIINRCVRIFDPCMSCATH